MLLRPNINDKAAYFDHLLRADTSKKSNLTASDLLRDMPELRDPDLPLTAATRRNLLRRSVLHHVIGIAWINYER